ncbi:MAG: P1 family peptidase [Gammaproteobacteria bacterium]|nr:P1 family peptidase [Gammaproteobacteria bacterium]MDH5584422.1 P1 family peptidase [Gammaproteobacteria bacterium]
MRMILFCLLTLSALPMHADTAPVRARDLGIPFDGIPGPLNAITDVAGVTVGHETIIRDLPDNRAVRTGVTAVLPRGRNSLALNVYAGWSLLNGNGEMTGTTWVEEGGFLEGPVMITNTHSVGAVHEGVIQWRVAQGGADDTGYYWSNPVVGETWDGHLNDINGLHVRPAHAAAALDKASSGAVAEGSVGGGTGMTCFDFKCGIGTASRVTDVNASSYTVGVLVQANFGSREELRIGGIPVGRQFSGDLIYSRIDPGAQMHSSLIVIVATDAPLLPYQLKRIARRVSLAMGVTGATGHNGSGDIFIAFSTANDEAARGLPDATIHSVPNGSMNPLFEATVHATEEAIINALVAGRDMTGDLGHYVRAIDHEKLQKILRQHGRLVEK